MERVGRAMRRWACMIGFAHVLSIDSDAMFDRTCVQKKPVKREAFIVSVMCLGRFDNLIVPDHLFQCKENEPWAPCYRLATYTTFRPNQYLYSNLPKTS